MSLAPTIPTTSAIQGEDIWKRFIYLVQWARGGHLIIVTPFISDFDIRGESVNTRILTIARATTSNIMIVAPPNPAHDKHQPRKLKSCYQCNIAAKKIKLMDSYSTFVKDLFIIENLHAKVYIAIDPKGIPICLAGSVNLTEGSFFKYHELGIYTTDRTLISTIQQFIGYWRTVGYGKRSMQYRQWRTQYLNKYPSVNDILEGRGLDA